MVIFSGNTLQGYNMPTLVYPQVLGAITGSRNDYRAEIAKYDWDKRMAWAVMMAESTGNPNAINWKDSHRTCRGSYGLFQLSCEWANPERLLVPELNIELAYEIWKQYGWRKWGAWLDGSYRKYLY